MSGGVEVTGPSAKVICDSISPDGIRLTTLQVTMHRFVLAEMNTHRVFSRNSASSRAIPVRKQLDKIENQCATPVVWRREQSGMQGGEELSMLEQFDASHVWSNAAQAAMCAAWKLSELGVHKSIVNRLLEPFMWHTVVVTSTEWDNFMAQRASHMTDLAQPEMAAAADAMFVALMESDPRELEWGQWHCPYLTNDDFLEGYYDSPDGRPLSEISTEDLCKISAARCARVSYLTQEGRRDPAKDIELYDRLVRDGHWSPLEHVARPCPAIRHHLHLGNFYGWDQLRHIEAFQQIA